MAACPTCGTSLDGAVWFCPHCGSLPSPPTPFSHGNSIILAVVLFLFVIVWKAVTIVPTTTQTTQPVIPEPPDGAAVLISHCGQPDLDNAGAGNGAQEEMVKRSLLYRKGRLKMVFVRVTPSSPWRMQGAVDARTLKPLRSEQVAKRLPCAASQTIPYDVGSPRRAAGDSGH